MFTQDYINDFVKNSNVKWSSDKTSLRVFIGTICNHFRLINPFETNYMPTEIYFHNQLKTNTHLSKSTIHHYMRLRDSGFYNRWEKSYRKVEDKVYVFKKRSQVYHVKLLGYKQFQVKNVTYGDNNFWSSVTAKHLRRLVNAL